jgi:hypothetical protein
LSKKSKSSVFSNLQIPANTIVNIASRLPANIAVLMKGPTGIGKSHVARDIANRVGLQLIEVRGSTMDEAGVSGIPDFEGSKTTGVSYFLTTSWFKRACEEPVVILLDELNRARPQVMQSFFQIVLDRELGNDVNGIPRRLHPETRIIAAINDGNEYDVNDMDPALLRRFWVCEFDPNLDEWISWARNNNIPNALIEFLQTNTSEFRVDPSEVEGGKVVPCPASWHRLCTSLEFMGMNPDNYAGLNPPDGFYQVCAGFVGPEASSKFYDHIKNMEKEISALDVFENFDSLMNSNKINRESASQMNKILDRMVNYIRANGLKKDNTKYLNNIKAFCEFAGGEITMRFVSNVIDNNPDIESISVLHYGALSELVLKHINESEQN